MKKDRHAGRWIAIVAILVILGFAGWIAVSQTGSEPTTREITGQTTQEIVSQMNQLIDDNVR